jgi:hypothetical protein
VSDKKDRSKIRVIFQDSYRSCNYVFQRKFLETDFTAEEDACRLLVESSNIYLDSIYTIICKCYLPTGKGLTTCRALTDCVCNSINMTVMLEIMLSNPLFEEKIYLNAIGYLT